MFQFERYVIKASNKDKRPNEKIIKQFLESKENIVLEEFKHGKGSPDFCYKLNNGKTGYVEVKANDDSLRMDQLEWIFKNRQERVRVVHCFIERKDPLDPIFISQLFESNMDVLCDIYEKALGCFSNLDKKKSFSKEYLITLLVNDLEISQDNSKDIIVRLLQGGEIFKKYDIKSSKFKYKII